MIKRVANPFYALLLLAGIAGGCSKSGSNNPDPVDPIVPPPVTPVKTDVEFWLTKGDRTSLFAKQNTAILFKQETNNNATIEVDSTQTYQTVDGFGFALTGGSAMLINQLNATDKTALIRELFGTDGGGIGISYLRVTLGASDLSIAPFTYDEITTGVSDMELKQFSIDMEKKDLIPVLKMILAVNPNIKILASPWTAPTWMKDNQGYYGGSLKKEYYSVYAQYFVKYINAMKAEGITIDAITPQNEPLNAYNNPSMFMSSADQKIFVRDNLGPAFESAGISTKILVYDHNLDHPEYATDILKDAAAAKYIDGSAFHLYGGNINAMSAVHDAAPSKNVYFTEQATFGNGSFDGDLKWHTSNLIIGAMRNWSRNVIEWNLASDPQFDPHTVGGCDACQGAITVGNSVARNVSYYIIAHASKFVRPGSVRIGSTSINDLQSVAYKTPSGKKVLVVLNNTGSTLTFNIKYNNKIAASTLAGGAVGTYIW
ncbi:glucosylceramidase [Mucilaginibacter sp. UR6-1]|uniref:glycoside hydrolase family 30 protein n=1 Tax=Mucilaginibacter sp. UR6-1 TaxID=1435643 RepID=UPI001E4144FE|nr:glycoside hydrolase family 30 beta sandwich domain-containing protein [Mucilaginibacter sp. UR6-1]MCC8409233.1 glucosylceramidase [Mucilaginibacter sp. UR6-1]